MKKFIQSILPGLFLIGFNIGTGSVTAMAKAGANYGMTLLWAVALSCLVTYYLIVIFGKFTTVTGKTALNAFRHHIHPAVGLFFIVALTVNVCGSIMGVMGIVSDVLHEWSKAWLNTGISSLAWAAGGSGLIYLLFLRGKTKFFEKALALMVAFMGAAFLVNFFIMTPGAQEILKSFIPSLPKDAESTTGGAFLVTASMVGTTVSSMIFIVRTTLVKEQGWTLKDHRLQKRDARVSAGLMFVISATIMAASAATLYENGIGLDHASEMITILKPIAGSTAVLIFVIGITAAGLSSQFPNILLLPWLICDYSNTERDMTKWYFRVIVLVMSAMALIVPVFNAPPVFVMIASQAFAAVVLPITVGCIFYLLNHAVMGEHKNGWKDNILLSLILIFSLVMSYIGMRGFVADFL